MTPRIPGCTYRLQLNKNFNFRDATALVDYLDALGVTDIYASPFLVARPGSKHGYDVIDHARLNPEIGTDGDLDALAAALKQRDMGLIMDVVPNHMCIASSDNHWWNDVLENGRSSPFAAFFDIDWHPPKTELHEKVLLPVLGEQYGRVLENQEISIAYEAGAFFAVYWQSRFPIGPRTILPLLEPIVADLRHSHPADHPDVLEIESIVTATTHLPTRWDTEPEKVRERMREKEIVKRRLDTLVSGSAAVRDALERSLAAINGDKRNPRSFDRLEALLADQAYRLSFWGVAAEEINYRRFFDINDLAAIRVELPNVLDAVHDKAFQLLRAGKVTGLRVDHVDGLMDPSRYLESLQHASAPVPDAGTHGAAAALDADRPAADLRRRREDPGRRRGAAAGMGRARHHRLRVPEHGQRPVRRRGRRACRRTPVSAPARGARRVRRSVLPGEAPDPAHRDVERAVRARAPPRPDLGATPLVARLHPEQPPPGAGRGDRLLPRLSHLRAADLDRGQRRRSPARAARDPRRQATQPVHQRVGVRLHRRPAAAARSRGAVRRRPRRTPRVRAALAAVDRPRDGQGSRRHGVLSLLPARVAERGGRAADGRQRRSAALPRLERPPPGGLAARPVGDRDARHQARRGRPRAPERALGDPARMAARAPALAAPEPAPEIGRRRRAHSRRQRGVPHLPDADRRLADGRDRRRPHRRRAGRAAHPHQRLHDQGAARGEGAHQLDQRERALRTGHRAVHRSAAAAERRHRS